jgi:hypothetical protein
MSYIFTWNTGFPMIIFQSRDIFGPNQNGTESVLLSKPVNTHTSLNSGVTGSNGIGTAGDPAHGGTGLNVFKDPAQIFNALRPFSLSTDTRSGRGIFHGLSYWNLDFSVGKSTKITERVSARLSVDAFNILNKINFVTSRFSILDPADFGVITGSVNQGNSSQDCNCGPRRLQAGLRLEF